MENGMSGQDGLGGEKENKKNRQKQVKVGPERERR